MKGISLLITLVFLSSLGAGVLAQDIEFKLPKAGITPDSPFYFLDRFGEFLQEFFTFNPEGKAHLQITFAAERIAEIKIILETKGVEAKGLDVAQARLTAHAEKAANIVEEEKEKGKDVAKLAGEIVDNFHLQRKAAKKVFEDVKQEFFTQKEQLHQELLVAIEAGDTEAQERVRSELSQIEATKDEAEAKKDAAILALEAEKDRLHDELEEKKRQEDEARDAAEEAEEAKKEAKERQKELEEEIEEEQAEAEVRMKEAEEKEKEHIQEEAEEAKERLEQEKARAEEAREEAEERQREAEERLKEIKKEAAEKTEIESIPSPPSLPQ